MIDCLDFLKQFKIESNGMTSFYDSYDYYKKMLQLQERLRKSEEERIRLEERFKTLMQESRNRHYTCISRLRLRYIEFLEEQRTKSDRNHKLLETVNSVDNSLMLMTAKINRLNVLKEQYEDYHRQMYAIHSLPENTIGGIDTMKTNENRNLKRNISVKRLSPEVKSRPSSQMVWLDHQTDQNFIDRMKNKNYNDGQKHVTQLKPINQQISDNQNSLQTGQITQQNSIQSPSFQNLQHLQYKLPYCQINSDLYVSRPLSSLPLNSLSGQNVSYLSKSPIKRMETIQMAPSRCKLLDVSQNQSRSEVSRDYVNPTVAMHSFRPENNKISLNDTRLRVNNVDEINYRSTPVIIEQNTPSISFTNPIFNLPTRTFKSYLSSSLKNVARPRKSLSSIPMRSLMTTKNHDTEILSENEEVQENESKATTALENELDRYIAKLDKLHRDHDIQSLKEVDEEQNTNGSTLNETLLNNNPQLYTENQSNESFPKDIEKVFALADDLASRTADLDDVNDFEERRNKNENLGSTQITSNDIPVSEKDVYSNTNEGRETSVAKDKINIDTALYEPKLGSHEDIEKSEKQNFNSINNMHASMQQEQPLKLQNDENVDSIDLPNDRFVKQSDNNLHDEEHFKEHDTYVSQEPQKDQYFSDIAEEAQNLESVEKQLEVIEVTEKAEGEFDESNVIINDSELKQENVTDVEAINEVKLAENQIDKRDSKEETNLDDTNDQLDLSNNDYREVEKDTVDNCETELNEVPVLPDKKLEYEDYYKNNENITGNSELGNYEFTEQKEFDNLQEEECYETNQISVIDQNNTQEMIMQDKEYNDQNCNENSNQEENYMQDFETQQFNVNDEYNYDQNPSYENNQDLNYDQNDGNQQQEYTEYIQESNEQCEPENQYEQDSNVQNEENLNQQYPSYEQSNENQPADEGAIKTDVDQSFEYMGNDDFNQSGVMQEDEDKESCKYEQSQQEESNQKVEVSEKFNIPQNKSIKPVTENESNQKKDVIKSLLDSDTDSTIERNISNTESDFDFN